mgnify:FL=1
MTRSYVAVVAELIKQRGWVSGKMVHEAEERGDENVPQRTSGLAASVIMSGAPEWADFRVTEQSVKLADAALAWAEEVLPRLVAEKPENDYLYNLRQVAKLEALNYRVFGIAASLIPAYQRDVQKNVSFEDRAARSQFVGEAGVRAEFVVQVSGIRGIQYRDGTTGTVIEFTDDEGNEMVWFTSGSKGFESGKTYRVKATVKRHSEFRGIKQTGLNRVQIMEAIA